MKISWNGRGQIFGTDNRDRKIVLFENVTSHIEMGEYIAIQKDGFKNYDLFEIVDDDKELVQSGIDIYEIGCHTVFGYKDKYFLSVKIQAIQVVVLDWEKGNLTNLRKLLETRIFNFYLKNTDLKANFFNAMNKHGYTLRMSDSNSISYPKSQKECEEFLEKDFKIDTIVKLVDGSIDKEESALYTENDYDGLIKYTAGIGNRGNDKKIQRRLVFEITDNLINKNKNLATIKSLRENCISAIEEGEFFTYAREIVLDILCIESYIQEKKYFYLMDMLFENNWNKEYKESSNQRLEYLIKLFYKNNDLFESEVISNL